MKIKVRFILIVSLAIFVSNVSAQIIITSGEDVTPEDLVENIVGEGVQVYNVQYQGDENAKGIFTNGYSTNIGMDAGIILCTGYASILQGPNFNEGATGSNGMPGDATLTGMANYTTYDAAVLQFDFIAYTDTIYFKYVFGSEEYPEFVGNEDTDVFGFFVTGPNPLGGYYSDKNIAVVPGSDPEVPVSINAINSTSYPEYYVDNVGGLTIEYDGFTTVLVAKLPIIPAEEYHIKMAIADVGNSIYDSGICLEENSFYSPCAADILSFNFEVENNPELPYPIIGEIWNDDIYLDVPPNTDVTQLVATYELHPGASAYIGGVWQQNGVTPNDFTSTVVYEIIHPYGFEKEWTVTVNIEVGVSQKDHLEIQIYPNPAKDQLNILHANGYEVSIVSNTGTEVLTRRIDKQKQTININHLEAGIYYLRFENEEDKFVRKLVIKK